MNQSEKISIIMITHNRAHLILQSVDSIVQQTYQNWELLIIDDGSTDDTEFLIKSIIDVRIFYHFHPRCAATGKLKNYGMNLSAGSFITFLDSDDLWAPEKLEKQLQGMLQNPGAGFSVTNGYNFKEVIKPLEYFYKQKEGIQTGNLLPLAFQSQLAAFTQALMVRMTCIELKGGFENEENKTMNDQHFILHLAYHFDGLIIYEPLVYRRIHTQNYIHDAWEKSYAEGADLIKKYRHMKAIKNHLAKDALFRLYINYGEKCLLYEKRKKALQQFMTAWLYRPLSFIPSKKMGKMLMHVINLLPRSRTKTGVGVPVASPGKL